MGSPGGCCLHNAPCPHGTNTGEVPARCPALAGLASWSCRPLERPAAHCRPATSQKAGGGGGLCQATVTRGAPEGGCGPETREHEEGPSQTWRGDRWTVRGCLGGCANLSTLASPLPVGQGGSLGQWASCCFPGRPPAQAHTLLTSWTHPVWASVHVCVLTHVHVHNPRGL